MDQFVVSARKYRPSTFNTVIGQSIITSTLKNAIRNNHIAHAYLFCGPRGVGKTTCARILAKTINCLNITDGIEACDKCESCLSFNEQRSYSIHELDAASNNSVDDIRLLIEKVRIPPQIGKYSIYIIDEVHMLSAAAFNAFLKTLEEPPKHALFILATTEKHKILPTILSRCQIFDFNRITIDDTTQFLASIAEKENISAEPDALNIIAQKADGGMRDALSIFDQVVSFSGNQISYKNVIENLNVLDYDYFFKLVNHFYKGNVTDALLIFDEILTDGFDAHNFIIGLAKHLRDLLMSQSPATIKLLEVGASLREQYIQQAKECSDVYIFEALHILNLCDINFKNSKNQRLHVELTLIKLCRINFRSTASPQPTTVAANPTGIPQASASVTPTTSGSNTTIDSAKPKGTPIAKGTPSINHYLKEGVIKPKDKIQNSEIASPAIEEITTQSNASAEAIEKSYNDFIDSIKNTNRRMYGTLQQKPMIEGAKLTIFMSNSVQLDEFNRNVLPQMSAHFRNTGIGRLDIEVQISEYEEQKKLYTDQEKYKHLLSMNPNLAKLQKKLNLDFE